MLMCQPFKVAVSALIQVLFLRWMAIQDISAIMIRFKQDGLARSLVMYRVHYPAQYITTAFKP